MMNAKQQISNLINGEKRTIRRENHEKYLTANAATSHVGYAGTNGVERARIAEIVAEQNPGMMTVEICGHVVTLTRRTTKSGKSWWWQAEIPEELANHFMFTDGILKAYTLFVNGDCTVEIMKCVRKTERQQWRYSYRQPIGEEFITILDGEVCDA